MSEHELSRLAPEDGRTLCRSTDIEQRSGAGSDTDASSLPPKTTRPVLLITLAIAATALVAWWAAPAENIVTAPPNGGPAEAMGPARTLLQSPELTELLIVQARTVDRGFHTIPQADLHRDVRKIMDEFGTFLDTNLDPKSRLALETAHIDPSVFAKLRKLFFIIRDHRLVQLGRGAYTAFSNLSATPEDVQRLLVGTIDANDTEIIPQEIRSVLRARRGMHKDIDLGFSPAAIDRIRRPDQAPETRDWLVRGRELTSCYPHACQPGEAGQGRRLSTGAGPMIVAIVTLGVSALIEIFVQLHLFAISDTPPLWLYSIFALPYVGLGGWDCGLSSVQEGGFNSISCDIFLGSLGLNLLEYTIVAPFTMGSGSGSAPAPAPAPVQQPSA